jgi:hypothetical protein
MPIILELVLYFGHSNSFAIDYIAGLLVLLAPTSILLLAAEFRTLPEALITVLFHALANAALYGLLGLAIGSIWDVVSKSTIRRSR